MGSIPETTFCWVWYGLHESSYYYFKIYMGTYVSQHGSAEAVRDSWRSKVMCLIHFDLSSFWWYVCSVTKIRQYENENTKISQSMVTIIRVTSYPMQG